MLVYEATFSSQIHHQGHLAIVLLQQHQLALDVDGLEAVEVLLPLRANHGCQEQPGHQHHHHDLLQSRWHGEAAI